MTNRSKILAAALGLLVAGGAVADASAATLVTKTRTVATTHAVRPVLAKKTVRIVRHVTRFHTARPYVATARFVPGIRVAPRIHVARAVVTKHIVKKTVIR